MNNSNFAQHRAQRESQAPLQGYMHDMGGFEALDAQLKSLFGEQFNLSDPESQRRLIMHLRNNLEQNEQLTNILERDPRMAQMLADVVQGKRNAPSAMARYFGSDMMNYSEESPEYGEIMAADEERLAEAQEIARNKAEYENNLEMSRPVIEEFCNYKGYEPEQFMDSAWEQLVLPILSGKYTKEVCMALDKAISYDRDIQDAFEAGNVKGRNTNIQRMKTDFGDGLPKGLNSAAPAQEERRKGGNSLIESALQA